MYFAIKIAKISNCDTCDGEERSGLYLVGRHCYQEEYLDGCWYLYYSDGTFETVSDQRIKK
jgi:hypothetical protein